MGKVEVRVSKLLSVLALVSVLLGFLAVLQLSLAHSSNVPQPPPTIQDFWINSTWAGKSSQFAFDVSDSAQLGSATLQTNCTGLNSNSTLTLSGGSAWANYTVTLPANDSVVVFQFWVWDLNGTIYATTGMRTMLVYQYNSTVGAWNTPYEYLGQAIRSVENTMRFDGYWNGSTDVYAQVILNQQPESALRSLIDNYSAAKNWPEVLEWGAFCNKLNITQYSDVQTDIKYTLGNYTMVGSLPYTMLYSDGSTLTFSPENKWALYGYYFNGQSWMGSYQNDTKWNITAAYQQFNGSCYGSVSDGIGLPLWIFANGNGESYGNRYYDEDACSIECYILFDELLNVSDGINQALYWWNYTNDCHWNRTEQHYGYSSFGDVGQQGYEAEAGFFVKIITELKYYYSSLDNWNNVLADIGSRFLSDEWNSYQWMDGTALDTAYAVVHYYQTPGRQVAENPQRRLYDTVAAWQALFGAFQELNATYQSKLIDMLSGNANAQPAWALLLTPSLVSSGPSPQTGGITGGGAGLFYNTSKMFGEYSNFGIDNNATAWGEILLFMLGIVPQTTTIAFPNEELNYEYIQNINPQTMNFNATAFSVEIPVAAAGTLTFQYGVSPITCYFNQSGVWTVTFTDSWNNIASVTYSGSPAPVIPEYPMHILPALAVLPTLTVLVILRIKRKKPWEKRVR